MTQAHGEEHRIWSQGQILAPLGTDWTWIQVLLPEKFCPPCLELCCPKCGLWTSSIDCPRRQLGHGIYPRPTDSESLDPRWLNPLFKIGHKRKLEPDDMYSVLPEDRSQHLGKELQRHWDQEVKRAQKDAQEPSLMKAVIKCYWKSYLIWGMFTFLEEGTRVVQPIFLGKMISYVENSNSVTLHEAYCYSAGLSACVLMWAVLHHLYFYHMQRVGMRLRVALCHMIYRKALRLSSPAMGKTTTGQIVNLLSNDVNRFDQLLREVVFITPE